MLLPLWCQSELSVPHHAIGIMNVGTKAASNKSPDKGKGLAPAAPRAQLLTPGGEARPAQQPPSMSNCQHAELLQLGVTLIVKCYRAAHREPRAARWQQPAPAPLATPAAPWGQRELKATSCGGGAGALSQAATSSLSGSPCLFLFSCLKAAPRGRAARPEWLLSGALLWLEPREPKAQLRG